MMIASIKTCFKDLPLRRIAWWAFVLNTFREFAQGTVFSDMWDFRWAITNCPNISAAGTEFLFASRKTVTASDERRLSGETKNTIK